MPERLQKGSVHAGQTLAITVYAVCSTVLMRSCPYTSHRRRRKTHAETIAFRVRKKFFRVSFEIFSRGNVRVQRAFF
jgi:hypothetical protein